MSLIHVTFFALTLSAQNNVVPPVAKKVVKTDTMHGVALVDNYHWLKGRSDPEVMKYIKAENAYTEAVMKPTTQFQKKLYEEILSRIKQTDMSVPYKLRDYWYYSKTEKGLNYSIYCRKRDGAKQFLKNKDSTFYKEIASLPHLIQPLARKGSLKNEEEVLLDVNEIIKKYKFYGVYGHNISPNDQIMAYYVDKTGNFELDVYFKDLQTGSMLPDTLKAVSSLVWVNDQILFYSIEDSITNRSFKIYKHILGTSHSKDQLIFHEKDPLYDLYLTKSKSEKYIFINSESSEQSEYWYLDAHTPNAELVLIHPREKGHLYYVYHHQNKFCILTDKDAINFKLMETNINTPSLENWKEIIPHREKVMIEEVEIFRDYLVLTENHRGIYKIRIISWSSSEEYYIPFEEETYDAYPGINPDFNTKSLRYTYVSLTIPYSIYEYNMEKKEQKLLKREEVLGGYDPAQYQSERLWASADDGSKIPISIVYKKGLEKNGKNPVLLEGYGAYGSSSFPNFSTLRLNFLERGFIYAIAHVRGGSDLGRQWYKDGKLLKKKNTFTDFIACAEHLIKENYTSKGFIVAKGGSAGGLLVGAVVNMRPDLFKAVILNVPFVDVINTMLDSTMPLTTQEYEEWGNPNEKDYFDYMLSYSPYENVKARDYPNMLFLSGMTDEQVSYWEPAKMVAKLRDMKTDNNKLLLKIQLSSGHGGVSGRYNYYKEVAFRHAFILTLFDMWE
ncbi:MAG: S9 family peptidase [Cytophagales bacterium]|nr:S9 family peptidase [Cytophagales bacterium]